ncbi:MAG: hypothetical protein ACRDPD_02770 [Streptosporangiaceae bacterium]
MADRHKTPTITFRPTAEIRAWLIELAQTKGQPVGAIVIKALREYKDRHGEAEPEAE